MIRKTLIAAATALCLASHAQTPQQAIQQQLRKVHANHGRYTASWNSLSAYKTPTWFQDAKFGIFLHWGVYSVPAFGNEWYSRNMYVPGNKDYDHHIATYGPQDKFGYKDFIPLFRAEHFNADAWVDLFQRAGARYIVPVGEHCDGFAMYDSAINPWNAKAMGPHRDVVGELATATRAHGLRFGVSSHTAEHWWWYGLGRTFNSDVKNMSDRPANGLPPTAALYGPASFRNLPNADGATNEKHEPDPDHLEQWIAPDKPFLDKWLAQSTEIVDKYHPDFMYFDWWEGQPAFRPAIQQFAAYYYNRVAAPVLTYKIEAMPTNTATLDIERGKMDTARLLPWQTDTSVSIHSWGYAEHDEYRTAKSLIHQLVDTVSKNGNLLLNVGPKSDGTIPEEARNVLLQMGDWLRTNGVSIYNTRPFAVFGEGPTKAGATSQKKDSDIQTYTAADIRYTVSSTAGREPVLYATLLGWPVDGSVTMHTLYRGNPYLASPVCRVDLLGSNATVSATAGADGLHVKLPATASAAGLGDIAYVVRIQTHCSR